MSDGMDPQVSGDDPGTVTTESESNETTLNTAGLNGSQGSKGSENNAGGSENTGQDSQDTPAREVPKWIYQLSGDLQKDERLSSFTKPDELAKAYLEYAGKAERIVELPEGEDAEGWNDVYGKLGRPEDPEKYDFSKIEIPDFLDDAELTTFRKTAHELGLTQSQAQKLLAHSISELTEASTKSTEAEKAEAEKAEAEKKQRIEALVEKYGDDFKVVVERAHRAYEAVGSKELGEYLDSTGMGDDPVMVDAFLSIADKIGEDTLIGSGRGSETEDNWYPNTQFPETMF